MSNILTKQKLAILEKEAFSEKNEQKTLPKILILSCFGLLGRVAFQPVPSVEPLLALAILACFYGGKKYSAPLASSYVFANYLMYGGQGMWGIFQFLGVLIAGIMASSFRKRRVMLPLALFAGTVAFEICVSSSWLFLTGIPSLLLAFLPAMPFSLVHIISTLGFGLVLEKYVRRFVRDEKPVAVWNYPGAGLDNRGK